MLLQRLTHVNYNIVRILLMNHGNQKTLKLKNSLTNELVHSLLELGIICPIGWQERSMVHMRAYSLLEQPYGSC